MGWLGAPPTKNALPTEPAVSAIDPLDDLMFLRPRRGRQSVPLARTYREDEKT